ncbi:uncharacterized protein DFL_008557 [Arthrobotrys flagrans]|uniref:NADP-dependent oxidoreductase domain-containing protein n=1 Tax=Arthrobotrys flagrans TaxID=97331 RepID=A0A436ZP84_ARTFL|nr:hypothetical protein DFL_008557 [Arthrobotrys flagrans]
MTTVPTIKLNHGGVEIPVIGYGLGTAHFKRADNPTLDPAITAAAQTALNAGFTHLDGAEAYRNEPELGIALSSSSSRIPRSSLFITTKLYGSISSPSQALSASLKKLGVDYVDLYLIHAPFWDEKEKGITIEEAWRELEGLYDKGLVKAIGVSNFGVEDLERIKKVARVPPAVNQIEYHPYLQNPELKEYHNKHGIVTAVYGPLIPITKATPGPLDGVIEELSKKYNKSATQILLRWAIDDGNVVITTSSKEWRIKEALAVTEFKLDDEDVERVRTVGKEKRHRVFWTKEFKE